MRVCSATTSVSALAAPPALAAGSGWLLAGDRNDWSPKTASEWQTRGAELLNPCRGAKRDPQSGWSALLSRVCSAACAIAFIPSLASTASGVLKRAPTDYFTLLPRYYHH